MWPRIARNAEGLLSFARGVLSGPPAPSAPPWHKPSEPYCGGSGTESSSNGSERATATGSGQVTISLPREEAERFAELVDQLRYGRLTLREALHELPFHNVQYLIREQMQKEEA